MPPPRLTAPTPRAAVVIAGAVVLGVVLYLGRHALTPFVLGALIVYVLDPAVSFVSRLRLGRWSIPRGLAVLLVYAVTLFVIVEGLALLLGPLIAQLLEFLRDLPRLVAAFESLVATVGQYYRSLDLPPQIRNFIDGAIAGALDGADDFDIGALLPLARTILGTAASFFGFLIVPIWAFYLLRDRVRLSARLDERLPPEWRPDVWAVLHIIERIFGRWVRAQILLGLIVGVATYFGLLLLGWFVDPRFLDFALLLAVIAGVLELLPIIGPIISMIPTLLIALTTADPFVSVLAVLLLYLLVQQLENAVLVPKIQGDAVELHPSVVILALIVGAGIAGLPGAILSIPLTAAALGVYSYVFRRASGDTPDQSMPAAAVDDEDEAKTDEPAADPPEPPTEPGSTAEPEAPAESEPTEPEPPAGPGPAAPESTGSPRAN